MIGTYQYVTLVLKGWSSVRKAEKNADFTGECFTRNNFESQVSFLKGRIEQGLILSGFDT